jgi:hypothetical protein
MQCKISIIICKFKTHVGIQKKYLKNNLENSMSNKFNLIKEILLVVKKYKKFAERLFK